MQCSPTGRLSFSGLDVPCIPLDLSFLSVRVAVKANSGVRKEQILEAVLRFRSIEDPVRVPGSVLRVETVPENPDIWSVIVVFDEKTVPMGFRAVLSDYFHRRNRSTRKDSA